MIEECRSRAITIQSDGNIIIVGRTWVPAGPGGLAAARYHSDGSLDTTFGIGGKLIDNDFSDACCILIQPEGKILIAGTTQAHDGCCEFLVARYNADGSLDSSFGILGRATADFSGGSAANAIAMQPDGKIIVLGTTEHIGGSSFALARYDRDGALDVTFGREGQVTTDFNINGWDDGRALAIQPDGKIVAAGAGLAVESGLRLARYNSDGSLDSTFGDQGQVRNGVDAQSVALQPDGKILVATVPFVSDIALFRYNENGSPDLRFGSGGFIFGDGWNALTLQSDGKFIAAGSGFAVARYNTVLDLIHLDRTTVAVNTSFTATFSGAHFIDRTYFDVRFRSPEDSRDQVVLDWQQGLSAPHPVAADTPAGTYIVTGIRPHNTLADSAGDFLTVSATLTVAP